MDFNKQIDELALQNEVTYVGVADLAPVHDAILEQGDEVMAGYPYAISLGIVMPNDIVDQLPNRSSPAWSPLITCSIPTTLSTSGWTSWRH